MSTLYPVITQSMNGWRSLILFVTNWRNQLDHHLMLWLRHRFETEPEKALTDPLTIPRVVFLANSYLETGNDFYRKWFENQ